MIDPAAEVEALSREFALACTADGAITWSDARCRNLIGVEEGASLMALAAPGTVEKMRALLSQSMADRTNDWEVALVVRGRPTTI